MSNRFQVLSLPSLVLMALASSGAHAASDTMVYQGVLVDGTGTPFPDGNYTLEFTLFTTPGGGTSVWSESHPNQAVSAGIFTTELGTINAFNDIFADNPVLFLRIRANFGAGSQTFSPRIPLAAAPYAIQAENANTLDGNTRSQLSALVEANVLNALSGTGNDSTVAGGTGNQAIGGTTSIGGGEDNIAYEDNGGTIGGGLDNVVGNNDGITTNAAYATVGGGLRNTASGFTTFVGGGRDNTASGDTTTVAGGSNNIASGALSFVGGGQVNTASGSNSVVGGGVANSATGFAATVPGGSGNQATGSYSFAAGRQAISSASGAFTWADSTGGNFDNGNPNSFRIRATGSIFFATANPPNVGAFLNSGSGTWISISDRNLKKDIEAIDAAEVLDKVADMPISEWTYTTQDGVRHIGPMAQDFHEAFGLGTTDTGIATIDADGVALAAIQGLNKKLNYRNNRISQLERELAGAPCTRTRPREQSNEVASFRAGHAFDGPQEIPFDRADLATNTVEDSSSLG